MNRGDVILVRFPHPSGCVGRSALRWSCSPMPTQEPSARFVVAEVTKNLTMAGDPACLFIDMSTSEGQATGLIRDSVVSCLVLVTVYTDTVAQVLGSLSAAMTQKLNDCLKAALGLP